MRSEDLKVKLFSLIDHVHHGCRCPPRAAAESGGSCRKRLAQQLEPHDEDRRIFHILLDSALLRRPSSLCILKSFGTNQFPDGDLREQRRLQDAADTQEQYQGQIQQLQQSLQVKIHPPAGACVC